MPKDTTGDATPNAELLAVAVAGGKLAVGVATARGLVPLLLTLLVAVPLLLLAAPLLLLVPLLVLPLPPPLLFVPLLLLLLPPPPDACAPFPTDLCAGAGACTGTGNAAGGGM